jgi:phage terminase large subunit-like protein
LTSSHPDELRGVQTPRIQSVPDYVETSGHEAVELCAAFGVHLDPWQQHVLIGALGERPDGKWSSFEVAAIVSRQNGKGEILLARQLAGLFLLGEQLIMHSAHEYKTAAEAFLRIRAVVENNDELRKMVKTVRTSHGEEGIELLNGQRLRFMARSKGSGRGFTADCVIWDEAYALGPEQVAATLPTLSACATGNPQVWYASSAGLEDSLQLAAVRERGITGDSKALAYYEWSADPRCDSDDPEAWAQANPALGYRINAEHIERERAAMPEVEFRRERLGVWDDASTNAVIPFDVWDDNTDRTSQPLDPVTFAIDISPDRAASSIAVAGRRTDGKWHVEVAKAELGTAWVVNEVVRMRRWTRSPVIVDSLSPAASLVPALTEAGVDVRQVNGAEYAAACGLYYDEALAGRLHHIDQTPLTAAVQGARQRPLGDRWAWNKRDATVDITPLVATTLALYGAAEVAAVTPKKRKRGGVMVLAD